MPDLSGPPSEFVRGQTRSCTVLLDGGVTLVACCLSGTCLSLIDPLVLLPLLADADSPHVDCCQYFQGVAKKSLRV